MKITNALSWVKSKVGRKKSPPPQSLKFVVVDGTNVAWVESEDSPQLSTLEKVRDAILKDGFEPVIVVSSALFYKIDDSTALKHYCENSPYFVQAPAREYDDRYVLIIASELDGLVLSRDQYRDLQQEFSGVGERMVEIKFDGGTPTLTYPPSPKKPLENLSFTKMKGKAVVVDGDNVAWADKNNSGQPQLGNVLAVVEKVRSRGMRPLLVMNYGIVHKIDRVEDYRAMMDRGEVQLVPKGEDGNRYILSTASASNAFVLSNNLYKKLRDEFPWYENRRLSFSLVKGNPIIDFQTGETKKPSSG